ncbi:hypothetical protein [Actinocorallia longicatena]|uniref:Uncharacterized protein n=1 Tax=Actinocorallia longicatena TaxID=111803 RepID=A0ABP6QC76_9ACTN
MTIERALAAYDREVKAAATQAETLAAQEQHRHTTAKAKAQATYELAVQAADTALETSRASSARMRAVTLAGAAQKLDAAVCAVLGVPDRLFLKTVSAQQIELWVEGGIAPLATASYVGPPGWVLDGAPGGRRFLGPGGETMARVGLWRIAADLPVGTR